MMRVYATVSIEEARSIFAKGEFVDLYFSTDDRGEPVSGVLVGEKSPITTEGEYDELVLVAEVPGEVFDQYEEDRPNPGETPDGRWRHAYIPAAVLNRYGRPRVHGHPTAGSSRRELVQAIRAMEGAGRSEHAAQTRAVMAFLDEIGWQGSPEPREPQGG
jgi:hypothetical protein